LESLKKCLNAAAIRRTLRLLPKSLDDTYERIISNIEAEYHEIAIIALKWLAFSERPLSITELAEAAVISPEPDVPFNEEDRLSDSRDVLQVLSSLVVTNGLHDDSFVMAGYEIVRLSHFSVKEYLISERFRGSSAAHSSVNKMADQLILYACLRYISYYDSAESKNSSARDLVDFPLLTYACKYWPNHVQVCDDVLKDDSITQLIYKHMTSSSWISSWVRVHNPEDTGRSTFRSTLHHVASPLYYAICRNLPSVCKYIIDKSADTSSLAYSELRAAIWTNNVEVARLLIGAGANVNAQSSSDGTAVQFAAYLGHQDVGQLLLESGADVNAPPGPYGNALDVAASENHTAFVELLIQHGADVNCQGGQHGSILHAAICRRQEITTRLLLEGGANVHAIAMGPCHTELATAARRGFKEGVQLLLQHGADVNAGGGEYGNALQAAVIHGDKNVVQMLLDGGADINSQGGFYGTALQAAAFQGNENMAKLLLENGAIDIEGIGSRGSALAAAWSGKFTAILMLLLGHSEDLGIFEVTEILKEAEGFKHMQRLVERIRGKKRKGDIAVVTEDEISRGNHLYIDGESSDDESGNLSRRKRRRICDDNDREEIGPDESS
jgi:ankyrin repeat protein